MAQENPYAKYAAKPANPYAGYVAVGDPDPAYKNKGPQSDAELKIAQAKAAQAAAQAAAQTRIDNASAEAKERENRDAAAADAATTMRRTSNLSGPAYLATLPADRRAIVSGLLQGNLPVGARGLTSPAMIPYIQDALNADPSFSAATFTARQKALTDLASAKATGGYLATTGAAVDHSREMEDAIRGLHNPSGWVASHGGAWLNNKFVNDGRPAGTTFDQANRVYSGELTKGIVGNIGNSGNTALSDRQEGERAMAPTMAQDSLFAGMRTGAKQLYQKLFSADQMYARTMGGQHIPDIVTPEQAKQLIHLMRLGDDGKEGPIPDDVAGNAAFMTLAGIKPDSGGKPGGAGGAPGTLPGGAGPDGTPPTIATGATHTVHNAAAAAELEGMIRGGVPYAQIAAKYPDVSEQTVDLTRGYLKTHPKYSGFVDATYEHPTTTWQQIKGNPVVQSVATGVLGAGDAAMLGTSDEVGGAGKSLFTGRPVGEEIAGLNSAKQGAFARNPVPALIGQTTGSIGSAAFAGPRIAALAGRYIMPSLAAPIVGDIAFGAASGAGQDNDNRLLGAVAGGAGGAAGNLLGQGTAKLFGAGARTAPGLAMTNAGRRIGGMMFSGRAYGPIAAQAPISSVERTTLNTIGNDLPGITAQLHEAQNLGVPLSLADTSPALRELTGAAVRRSPTAAGHAEQNLLPRSAGQYDRFTSAVDRNLGPTVNIPQRSADLTAQARTAAGPLYDKAYAAPVLTTPELEATLNTPFGRQALARARTITQNERRDPAELGFAQDAQGNVILNRQPYQAMSDHLAARQELDAAQAAYRTARETPGANTAGPLKRITKARQGLRDAEAAMTAAPDPSQAANVPGLTTQTLDYIKRGMDDVLEQQRNPITGKLVLDEAGRAQDTVRKQFLAEVDKINPAYADARAAYAGPASERSNMAAGQDAYTAQPQQLGVDLAGSSPERIGQMQLGYQGALVDHAGRVRDSGNPWEATLGSPMARDRFSTMFPDTPGLANFFRQRELEGGMQQTSNAILGNSRTARNLAADQAFAGNPIADAAVHGGLAVATHGASLPGTAMRMAGSGLGDWWKLGNGASAVAKADALVPTLTQPDPGAALGALNDILARQQAYKDFLARTTPTRPLGMFGAGLGSQAALAPLTYAGG